MNTPQTDTPETEMTLQEQLIAAHRRIGIEHTEMQVQRDRAIAAEARLAKWESELSKVMPQDFKDWWQNSRDEWPEVASMVIEGLRKQVEMTDKAADARVKELESDLRLRPIAEAGPVPEGAERLWASYIDEMQTWSVYPALIDPSEFDTHFIDIYPPQQ